MRHHDFSPQNERHQRGPRGRGAAFPFGSDWDLTREMGGPGQPGRRPGRRGRGRGGDVRAAALLLLAEQPRHGYQLIQDIAERSEGRWTPSPGSIYPVLQQLEDEGLVEFERVDGRKTATLTDEGRAYVDEHRDALGTPWDSPRGQDHEDVRDLAVALKGFIGAWKQVARDGTAEQREKATAVVVEARKALYRVLADDDA